MTEQIVAGMNFTKPAGHRREVHASQMTVPETPSPDVVAAKRKGRSNLGRQAGVGALKARSKQVGSPSHGRMHGHGNAHPHAGCPGGHIYLFSKIHKKLPAD